jgi:hypothetical protein
LFTKDILSDHVFLGLLDGTRSVKSPIIMYAMCVAEKWKFDCFQTFIDWFRPLPRFLAIFDGFQARGGTQFAKDILKYNKGQGEIANPLKIPSRRRCLILTKLSASNTILA